MTTTEGNKLIVTGRNELRLIEVFMGYADGYLSQKITWNDLMPVVEKIEDIDEDFLNPEKGSSKPYEVAIVHKTTVEIYDHQQQDTIVFVQLEQGNSKIEAVYSAVIQFIEWYNKNQQP